ncbi:MAG: hypothetical protein HY033_07610 [Ignavibacteriae bacterium]|nr:hypothetical protein [Ignavibacteriota bacterium]
MTTQFSPSPTKKTNWIQLSSYVLIVILAVETVFLIKQNSELKATIKLLSTSPVELLKPGNRVEPVKVQTLDGATTDLTFSDPSRMYLICIFSTTCPHCEKAMLVWDQISRNIEGGQLSIIGISTHALEETKNYVTEKKPGLYIVSAASDTSFSRKFKIPGVPETILMRGDRTVVKAWVGELQPTQVEEIKTLLSAAQATLR